MPVPTSSRERAYVELCVRDMHPDLFTDVPEPDAVQDLRRRYNFVDQMNDLQKVYLLDGFDLPYTIGSTYFNATEYDYSGERGGTKENGWTLQKESLDTLRKMVATLRSNFKGLKFEKKYEGSSYRVLVTFPSGLEISINMNRGAVCKRKVVGQVWREPIPGRHEDIVEWDCGPPVSILANV